MKQSQKAWLPKLNLLVNFYDFIARMSEENNENCIAHCREMSSPNNHFSKYCQPNKNILLLIGPEGDFSEQEISIALDKGFKPVSLGTSRLRTETAGVVATTIFNHTSQ